MTPEQELAEWFDEFWLQEDKVAWIAEQAKLATATGDDKEVI